MTDDLQEHLAETPVDFIEESWRIDGFETANWAMRKLKAAQERLDTINRQAMDEAAKISDWANRVAKAPLRDKTYFENALIDYMVRLRAATGEKSLVLPDGEVNSRSIPAKAQVSDLETFVKWCLENGREGWVRTKESANLDALKEEVAISGDMVVDTVSGVVIDGLMGVDADISVSVKVSR